LRNVLPRQVDHLQGKAIDHDANAREVVVQTLTRQVTLAYDWLVVATGSRSQRRVPSTLPHHHTLEALPALTHTLRSLSQGARLAVIGGGITGLEVVTELAEAYPQLNTTWITSATPEPALGEAAHAYIAGWLRAHDVEHHAAHATQVVPGEVLTREGHVGADVVIEATGLVASPAAAQLGLPVDTEGRVPTDPWLRPEGMARVYVAGDAAGAPGEGSPWRLSCAAAMPMGAWVAEAIAAASRGRPIEPLSLRLLGPCISLGRRDGLIQRHNTLNEPVGRPITGRKAALIKEMIVRMTVALPRWEARLGLSLYRWPRAAATTRARLTATRAPS